MTPLLVTGGGGHLGAARAGRIRGGLPSLLVTHTTVRGRRRSSAPSRAASSCGVGGTVRAPLFSPAMTSEHLSTPKRHDADGQAMDDTRTRDHTQMPLSAGTRMPLWRNFPKTCRPQVPQIDQTLPQPATAARCSASRSAIPRRLWRDGSRSSPPGWCANPAGALDGRPEASRAYPGVGSTSRTPGRPLGRRPECRTRRACRHCCR